MILRPRSLYKILGSCISLLSYARVLLKLNFFCSKLLRFIYLAGTVPLLSLYSDAEFQYVHCLSVSSISSVQFSRSVVSDSLWPHEPQHTRPPCPSPTPGVYSNSCPSSRWWHPAISSSVIPFSSCPQSLQASGSFPMSQLFTSGAQSTGVSASASVLPMNTQNWSLLGWTGLDLLAVKGILGPITSWQIDGGNNGNSGFGLAY